MTAFHENLRGWSEISEGRIAGRVVGTYAPSAPVEVQLYMDNRFIADGLANVSHPGASIQNHTSDSSHDFQFDIPPLDVGNHVAEVYVVRESGGGARRVLQLIGNPVRFAVVANDKNTIVVR